MKKVTIPSTAIFHKNIALKISYLEKQKDITELLVTKDCEYDYNSFTIAGVMFKSDTFIYPAASGFDIGCGVGCYFTNIPAGSIPLNILNEKFIPKIKQKQFKEKIAVPGEFKNILQQSKLGDIEEGNHFIELRKCNDKIVILIHSGLPAKIKKKYAKIFIDLIKITDITFLKTDNAYLLKLNKNSSEFNNILKINEVLNFFAKRNRQYLAYKILDILNGKIIIEIDNSHEFIKKYRGQIIHSHGVQQYTNNLAVILCGKDVDNFVVKFKSGSKFINHGTQLLTYNSVGSRIYGVFENLTDQYTVQNILSPFFCCKKNRGKYEYTLFQ